MAVFRELNMWFWGAMKDYCAAIFGQRNFAP